MSLHHNIQFNSEEFLAIINNDIHYVKNHFSLYEPLKDYWLTVASFYSNLEMNEFFVSKGANPHFNNNENFTNAIYQNKLELVKFYASHNCVLLKNNEEHFGGAILDAVRHNNLDILKYLIDLGCDIHLNNDFAFNVGIAENSFDCVRLFSS